MRKNYTSLFLVVSLTLFAALFNSASAQILPKVKADRERKNPVIIERDSRKETVLRYPRRRTANRYPASTRRLPPGQAKKIYGEKSARDFAPGHQKNKSYGYNSDYEKNHYKKYGKSNKKSGKHDKD